MSSPRLLTELDLTIEGLNLAVNDGIDPDRNVAEELDKLADLEFKFR